MQHRPRLRFGRVHVQLHELDDGVLDFAKRLKANAPETAAEVEAAAADELDPADQKPAVRSDGIEGDDMSDDEGDIGARKKKTGGKNIFDSIISKWSALSALQEDSDGEVEYS